MVHSASSYLSYNVKEGYTLREPNFQTPSFQDYTLRDICINIVYTYNDLIFTHH